MKRIFSFLLIVTLFIGLMGCSHNNMELDTADNFEVTRELSSGGNYIMVVYEDFTGSIEMNCDYVLQDEIYAE